MCDAMTVLRCFFSAGEEVAGWPRKNRVLDKAEVGSSGFLTRMPFPENQLSKKGT